MTAAAPTSTWRRPVRLFVYQLPECTRRTHRKDDASELVDYVCVSSVCMNPEAPERAGVACNRAITAAIDRRAEAISVLNELHRFLDQAHGRGGWVFVKDDALAMHRGRNLMTASYADELIRQQADRCRELVQRIAEAFGVPDDGQEPAT